MEKKLVPNKNDKMLFGVCGGIADYFDWSAIIVRIAFVISVFVFDGAPLLAYLFVWLLMRHEANKVIPVAIHNEPIV